MSIGEQIAELHRRLPQNVSLVAVSKTYPPEKIMEAYDAGQRIFGENRPQEMRDKHEVLPKDIRWHLIGHLQTNKVKYVAPYVEMIHSVDSERLLEAIDKEAGKNNRVIDILFEVFIAQEETKHGWEADELTAYIKSGALSRFGNVRVRGLMGIATNTDDMEQVRREFAGLHNLLEELKPEMGALYGNNAFDTLSMGMTSDWETAVECGSTMVRIGSLIFGARDYGIR